MKFPKNIHFLREIDRQKRLKFGSPEIRSRLSFRFESESQDWIRVPESQIRIWTP